MPRPEFVERALALITKRPVNHAYFFSKLDTPDWIEPLREAGLFRDPPPPRYVEEDLISFPPWPESEYLARMAPLAPEEVGEAILAIPATENVWVRRDLALAAAHIPVEMAVPWAKKEAEWLSGQESVQFPIAEALGPVVVRLAEAGRIDVAIALASPLLELRAVTDSAREGLVREPSVGYRSASATSEGGDGGREERSEIAALAAEVVAAAEFNRLVPRIDPYEYAEFVRLWMPGLLTHGGTRVLAMLCDILEPPRDANVWDGVTDPVARPAIESHEQNYRRDATDCLVDAVRDGSMQLVDAGLDIRRVAEVLNGRRGTIFSRMLLHLSTEKCATHPRFAAELTVNEDRFFDHRLLHEYSRLLGAVFPKLDASDRGTVLEWIEGGPPLDDRFDGDEEARRKILLHWQARRLAWIRKDLDDEWTRRYERIVDEIGEPEHPDFVSYATMWMGSKSPVSVEDIKTMSVRDVAAYLDTWQPPGDPMSADLEGLTRVLEEAVARSPARFLAAYEHFVELPARYVLALVRGLHNAVQADRLVDWNAVAALLSRVAKRSSGDRKGRFARQESASLLAAGLRGDVIQYELREAVWALIDALADDADPTAARDAESTLGAATDAMNSVRGRALQAVVHYGLWVYRALASPNGARPASFSMDTIPEVRKRLDRHLDPNIEPSPAVRAVYGHWFPHLVLLDADWARRNVGRIFPSRSPALRDAAWETYLRFCPAYNAPFRVLRQQYMSAVDRLPETGQTKSATRGDPGRHLGEHLLVMAGRGLLSWDDDDALLRGYFKSAAPEQARGAISSIGQGLREKDHEFPREILARFASLAESLTDLLREAGGERMGHLRSLGWWISSGRFGEEWTLEQLRRLVELAGPAEPRVLVMEHLAELSGHHPTEALAVLEAWIGAEAEVPANAAPRRSASSPFGRTESACEVLRAALASPPTRDRALALIDRLLAAGHHAFRGLEGSS